MDFELEMRVLTLDMGVVEWCGRELEMKAREFDPELVIAIARSGVTLAKYMFEDVPHLDVDIHRPSTGWKRKMRSIMRLTRFLPRWIGDELRISEAKRLAKHKPRAIVATPEAVKEMLDAAEYATRILVVDDAVDSGATLRAVFDALKDCGAEVRGASIALTRPDPVAFPYYHIFQPGTLVRFPWSSDARRRQLTPRYMQWQKKKK